jgi:hypothetical protein
LALDIEIVEARLPIAIWPALAVFLLLDLHAELVDELLVPALGTPPLLGEHLMRKIVLKVAQSAYRHLNNAVKRLKKIVLLNKEHDKVISEKPVGLDFTKKLLHTVGKSVKKAVKKAKKAGIKHLRQKPKDEY